MNALLGIMQGRFTDKDGFFPQEFPWEDWPDEFWSAKYHNIDFIEWMFNAQQYHKNPLWTSAGRAAIKNLISETGIAVYAICANYFMQHSITDDNNTACILDRLVEAAEDLGCRHIVIPLFEASGISDKGVIHQTFRRILERIGNTSIAICFESDLPASEQKDVCDRLGSSRAGICFDVGNAAGNGYDSAESVQTILDHLYEIHLKDKRPKGTSVMLGEGAVNFGQIFEIAKSRKQIVYTLESYFGRDTKIDTAKNIQYILEKLYE